MRSPNIQNSPALVAGLAALAWLPAPARAQFTLTLSPSTVTAQPGSIDVQIFGSLTNLAGTPVDFVTEDFNLISGPSTADLTTAVVFSGDNLTNPQIPLTLGANQVFPGPTGTTFAPLFFLDVDPGALPGVYTGNFTITYGGQTLGRDITVNVRPPSAVPEASTLPLLMLGTGYLGYVLFTARRRRKAAC